MWVRQFSRDRDRGRGSIDEAEVMRGDRESGRGEAEARQSENHVNALDKIHEATHTPNTFSLNLKTLF